MMAEEIVRAITSKHIERILFFYDFSFSDLKWISELTDRNQSSSKIPTLALLFYCTNTRYAVFI